MKVFFITIAWPNLRNVIFYSDLMDEFVIRGMKVLVLSAEEKVDISSFITEKSIKIFESAHQQDKKGEQTKKSYCSFFIRFNT
ncbi:MAG: hypothetical protein U5L72_06725 [Bacteroidales bacterium]|nr:hypothetical protein [Bacteroidales bacterium]